jgi:hypothetical protein
VPWAVFSVRTKQQSWARVTVYRMRAPKLILVAGLILLALAVDVAEAPAKAGTCASKGSVTARRTETVRIFIKKHVYYGCDRRRGRKMRLGLASFGSLEDHPSRIVVLDLVVKNYFVAYRLDSVPRDGGPGPFGGNPELRWVDLRHVKRLSPEIGCTRRLEPSDGNGVWGIVLGSNGAIAWVCSDAVASEVHKIDSAGPNVLDTVFGPPWDMSLDLGEFLGVTVYWANRDGLHASRLIGPARLF